MKIILLQDLFYFFVALYEKSYTSAPEGKTFQKCYDVKKVAPTDEYIKIYNGTRKSSKTWICNPSQKFID